MNSVKNLIKMANQIADNFSFHDDEIQRIADHMQRFWAPSMQKELIDFHAAGGDGLKPSVINAIQLLKTP